MIRLRVLCAPNAFKGTMTAREAAEAMARGVERAGGEAIVLPVADGGDGTASVLGGEVVKTRATGPFGERLAVEYRMRAGGEAVIEVAQVGLARVKRRDPLEARSDGVGEMMLDAMARGARRLTIALGGSATVDGGAGMARALGGLWLDARGRPWMGGGPPESPVAFRGLRLGDVQVTAACDVATRLSDAARLFGPQKGASPAHVRTLQRRLARMAALAGPAAARLRGSGAAGGIGWALASLYTARLVPGADLVLAALHFPRALRRADLVLTGEGRWDVTSTEGKAPWAVLRAARRAGVPAAALCGVVEGDARGVVGIGPGALKRPRAALESAVYRFVREWRTRS